VHSLTSPPELEAALASLKILPLKPTTPFLRITRGRRKGHPYTGKSLALSFREWRTLAKLPERCTPHGLRRRFATDFLERATVSGMSEDNALLALKTAGGWESLTELQRYILTLDLDKVAFGLAKMMRR
jgi:hypothetical protein